MIIKIKAQNAELTCPIGIVKDYLRDQNLYYSTQIGPKMESLTLSSKTRIKFLCSTLPKKESLGQPISACLPYPSFGSEISLCSI